jgi:hypothetical protein
MYVHSYVLASTVLAGQGRPIPCPAVSRAFFEQVIEALIGFLPPDHGGFSSRVSGRNAKVWLGEDPRIHYEAQTFKRRGQMVLEVGLHAEHPDAARNDEVLARLREAEGAWRAELGAEVEVGSFAGRGGSWRRASEIWDDFDPEEPGGAVEAADRLAAYITAFEPLIHR